MSDEVKKPRLMMWCEGLDAWTPASAEMVWAEVSEWNDLMDDGERFELAFKWILLTDKELDELPDG